MFFSSLIIINNKMMIPLMRLKDEDYAKAIAGLSLVLCGMVLC
jgi:hypothetical protein